MREFLKSSRRWLSTGWFWPLVLLALPNCVLGNSGLPNPNAVVTGESPTSAVMCFVPKLPDPNNPENCADANQKSIGMSQEYAAVALAQGEHNSLALDFSPDAITACSGQPRKTDVWGQFPDGVTVCLNCLQVITPDLYPDDDAVCAAKCKELNGVSGGTIPAGGLDAFCAANAHVSPNFDKTTCYTGVCDTAGTPPLDFPNDPRKQQEPVTWVETVGTSATLNTLTRTKPIDGTFDAGAVSDQKIEHGDAWVEFQAKETGVGHVLGVRNDPGGPDSNPGFGDIQFGISLDTDNNVYIIEGGNVVAGPFGTYQPGERFRVRIKDNNNISPHTATISYFRVSGTCTPATICKETPISDQVTPAVPTYPFKVDAALFANATALATVENVTLVRIR